MRTRAAPEVSVIVASHRPGRLIHGVLAGLRDQETAVPFETIVVDSSNDGTAESVRERFPEVRVLASRERLWPGGARNRGVAAARGRIVAFTDTDCRPPPDWIERIAVAHRAGHRVVGGAIAPAAGEGVVARAAYLCEFAPWLPVGPVRELPDVPTANLALDRTVLETAGPFRAEGLGSDTAFNWTLAARGMPIRFDPALVVVHVNRDRLGPFLLHEFGHGRDFARMRVAVRRFSPARRLAHAAGWPLVALRLLLRRLAQILRAPLPAASLLAAAPLVAAGMLVWTLGEAAGYLQGSRR